MEYLAAIKITAVTPFEFLLLTRQPEGDKEYRFVLDHREAGAAGEFETFGFPAYDREFDHLTAGSAGNYLLEQSFICLSQARRKRSKGFDPVSIEYLGAGAARTFHYRLECLVGGETQRYPIKIFFGEDYGCWITWPFGEYYASYSRFWRNRKIEEKDDELFPMLQSILHLDGARFNRHSKEGPIFETNLRYEPEETHELQSLVPVSLSFLRHDWYLFRFRHSQGEFDVEFKIFESNADCRFVSIGKFDFQNHICNMEFYRLAQLAVESLDNFRMMDAENRSAISIDILEDLDVDNKSYRVNFIAEETQEEKVIVKVVSEGIDIRIVFRSGHFSTVKNEEGITMLTDYSSPYAQLFESILHLDQARRYKECSNSDDWYKNAEHRALLDADPI